MPTKTISLELDAYGLLRDAKRGGESFSEVVRRVMRSHRPDASRYAPVIEEGTAGYRSEASVQGNPISTALSRFDEATARQRTREQARGRGNGIVGGARARGRGWTRDQLYTRGSHAP